MLLPDLRPGGAERVVINLADALVRRGIPVDLVLLRAEGELLGLQDPAVRIVDLAVERIRRAVGPLVDYLRQEQPAAMLANMWPLPVMALVARWRSGVATRVVGVEHTTWSISELYGKSSKRLQITTSMRLLYRYLDGLVAVSQGAADDLARVSGRRRESIRAIHNPIVNAEPATAATAVLPDAWANGTHCKLLSVGTLKAIKDLPVLIRAFAALCKRLDARLMILGEGEQRAELEALAASLGLQERVFMPGFVVDTRDYYQAADLFVLTSRGEGFGNVLVEALHAGTPVVSTDCPSGPREILAHGKYGALVPVGDVDALTDAMQDALSRPHDHEALQRRAQDFGVNKAVDGYLDLLLPGWRGQPA